MTDVPPVRYYLHMAKNKKNLNKQVTQAQDDMKIVRRAELVRALQDGRRQRAVTFVDRKKQADKRACRNWRTA